MTAATAKSPSTTPATDTDADALRIENVGRRFGSTDALQGFDLTVRRGEFIALLGPSGCGKSTALNCLAGLLPLTDGRILVGDQRIDVLPPEKRDFGMVFQSYALFPHLTVAKNVAFGLQMRGVGRGEIRRRVDEALRLVRLEDQAGKLPGQLSGGQQQRVAIARAVVIEPRVVLMDEPLSNLDAKLRLEMRTEIRRLHQTLGLTTIYVTHDQEEALSLADRLVVLRAGRVQQIGTPQELHDHPANWHVADFMGYRNLLDAEVTSAPDGGAGGGDGDGAGVEVRADGLSLRGLAVDPVAAGERVRLAIRPSDLVVTDPAAAPGTSSASGTSGVSGASAASGTNGAPASSGTNMIRARVEVVEYQGREYAVEVRTESGRALHVRSDTAPQVGVDVLLTLDPARALVYRFDLDPADAGRSSDAADRAADESRPPAPDPIAAEAGS
ncbi:spermidine/putrescine ABC transporter ATP-binding protein [Brachybacterium endophyticum]|uniref:Spermidine/putrescine ABC transporter ATP-binding protein n=1 Tax=Brachybacterium endophyticum TaxID=2182385 RepID=A0A2U2RNI8_9MICO|nr:ABC transporter ATP-binding protein [Brachybacterium endophyticum]PWH07442.1 spermidine/putrescine ABC transporter ATP-binding protein [Brachybacterium endophyticum]